MAGLKPSSLVINATGLGKDVPGSPITDAGLFPQQGIAWDLNYRGDLVFLDQARRQQLKRNLQVGEWLDVFSLWLDAGDRRGVRHRHSAERIILRRDIADRSRSGQGVVACVTPSSNRVHRRLTRQSKELERCIYQHTWFTGSLCDQVDRFPCSGPSNHDCRSSSCDRCRHRKCPGRAGRATTEKSCKSHRANTTRLFRHSAGPSNGQSTGGKAPRSVLQPCLRRSTARRHA